MAQPETRYATRGDVHIAYQVVGEGEPTMVLVSTWFSHVEARWEIPAFAHYLRRLSSFTRLVSFDKFGIGLSDPVPSPTLPPLETWTDDIRAVMDAIGCERAVIAGANEGTMMAALFAGTFPERTEALVLLNGTARIGWAPDYELGVVPEAQDALVAVIERTWGSGDAVAAVSPSVAGDPHALEAWGRFLRLSASPATAAAVTRVLFQLDVRGVLPSIQAPTLVVNRKDAAPITADQGRYLAEHIPGATFVLVPGVDFALAAGDVDPMLDEVEEFLTGSRRAFDPDRALATVLFTDIVGSTEQLAQVGDESWRVILDAHEALVRRQLSRYGGVLVELTGDGIVATFDGPARAIRSAVAIRDGVRALGLRIRSGLHTGEVERRGSHVSGLGVHLAARVQQAAGADEVLVTRTVKDLVAGAGFEFDDRGDVELKGVPEPWQLFCVRL